MSPAGRPPAPGIQPPEPSDRDRLHPSSDPVDRIAYLQQRILKLESALKPFALYGRDGYSCKMGGADVMLILNSGARVAVGDFRRAEAVYFEHALDERPVHRPNLLRGRG